MCSTFLIFRDNIGKRCTVRIIKYGDENTKFFHRMASKRLRNNSISSLQAEDGSVVSDHASKEGLLFTAYKNRLGTRMNTQMNFDLHAIIKRVDGLEVLTAPFTHEEIDDAVKAMPTDRAPGPDGFCGHFIKSCWHLIKDDFYTLCDDFHAG